MDAKIFRKGDAANVFPVEKSWDEIFGKPTSLDEVTWRIIQMMNQAASTDYLTRPDTVAKIKAVVNKVLIKPLSKPKEEIRLPTPISASESSSLTGGKDIFVDALWDEISDIPEGIETAFKRALQMFQQSAEFSRLTSAATKGDVKTFINDGILEPLKGRSDDE